MATDPNAILALVEAELTRRLTPGGGEAVEEWTEGQQRMRLIPTSELRAMRKELIDEVGGLNPFGTLVPLQGNSPTAGRFGTGC